MWRQIARDVSRYGMGTISGFRFPSYKQVDDPMNKRKKM